MATLAFPSRYVWPTVNDAIPVGSVENRSAAAASMDAAATLLIHEEQALRRTIARYVKHATIVDDLFQEISLKVMRRIDSVRDPQALRGWLFQLARNACLDWLRAPERRTTIPSEHLAQRDAVGDLGRNPADKFMANERIAAVQRALKELPESQREVLRLRVDEGLDHEAIALRLGISRQAVEVRLCRGRARLKEQLEDIIQGDL